jgi:hypothetical protein
MSINWYIGAEDQDVGAFTGALNWALSNFDSLIELLEPSDLDDLITSINNEISARVQSDEVLLDSFNLLNQRINNLLYDPIPSLDTKNGSRKYLNEFIEVLSTDQIDGLEQRLSFFTNALQGKLSGISASSGTGITIDSSNPAYPNISQNRPLWNNVQGKPSIPNNIESRDNKGIANGYPSLDSNAQIPISQLPILASALIIVPNIAQRNLIVPTGNLTVFVRDATGDPTVSVGWATYLYDFDNSTWIKKSEGESLDLNIVQSWLNITGKPTEFNPTAHNQDISTINGLDTVLLSKRNITDIITIYEIEDVNNNPLDFLLSGKMNIYDAIPAIQITESPTKTFIRADERIRWNNTLLDLGTVSTNQSLALNLNNSFKITLGENITLTLNTARAGQVTKIKFIQDAVGNRTVTLPGNCVIATGESIDLGANKKSLLLMDYDGTEFLCSWKKGW